MNWWERIFLVAWFAFCFSILTEGILWGGDCGGPEDCGGIPDNGSRAAAAGGAVAGGALAHRKYRKKKKHHKDPCPPAKGLGSLSEHYEAGRDGSKAIGWDKAGGWSYGKYQFATGGTLNVSTMKDFLDDLKTSAPDVWKQLDDAGGYEAAKEGTDEFKAAWKKAAEDPALQAAEHDFIERTHYDPSVDYLNSNYSLDVNQRSAALQDVIWSVSVQFGVSGTEKLLDKALNGKDISKMSDQEIIDAIYDERGRTDANGNMVHFKHSTKKEQDGVKARFKHERDCAQKALAAEEASRIAQDLHDLTQRM